MFAKINATTIHYEELGTNNSTAVIFIHGFPFNLEMWKPQLSAIGKKYRAIAYDLRGFGKSSAEDPQYTIENHVDDLFALIDQLQLKKPVIVGLSMGGYIALRAVERDQSKFGGLVLCDTKSEADGNEAKLKRSQSVQEIKSKGVEGFVGGFLQGAFAAETFASQPDLIQTTKTGILNTRPASITGNLIALAARTDTTEFLEKIRIPTLILVGEKDPITTPAHAKAMSDKIRGSVMHIIPNAAHMSNLENASVFNEQLDRFLDRL